jgi:uncharacterized protein (DUF1778 family)
MKRSPYTILNPTSARFSPDQVALLDIAAKLSRSTRSDLLRAGALALAEQVVNSEPGIAQQWRSGHAPSNTH